VTGFGDLTITADGADTIIDYGTGVIRLQNIAPDEIEVSDFLFG
jgi:hypothetical protein